MTDTRQHVLFPDAGGATPEIPVALGEFDWHFGEFMERLADSSDPSVGRAAALLAHSTAEGHSCLELARWAGRRIAGEDAAFDLPVLQPWLQALHASGVAGEAEGDRPLVIEDGRLYLRRYWEYEQEVADGLTRRAVQRRLLDGAQLRGSLERFFPSQGSEPDWQKMAACVAASRDLCIISGGPGTGKTSTVLRILGVLAEGLERPLRTVLAAPTGKATVRLQDSIRHALDRLELSTEARGRIPSEAVTLHRLLGARPGSAEFRHDRDNPLDVDLVVVDEASMIDLALMARLLRALPEQARLILLGDHHQLASVEAGAVLGDICSVSGGFSPDYSRWLGSITGYKPESRTAASALSDSIVFLKRSYRFDDDSGIGALARLINDGDGEGVCRLLADGKEERVQFHRTPVHSEQFLDELLLGYAPLLEKAREPSPDASIFEILDRFRVLCGLREGPAGVVALNGRMERHGIIGPGMAEDSPSYAGRPVLITRNDYALRLYNGDTGVMTCDEDDYTVLFPGRRRQEIRHLSPGRLPEHETAFAMTVHKAQGSEFDEVLLVLPPRPSPVVTRELIYTAVTRARRGVRVAGAQKVLKAAVESLSHRASGLAQALRKRAGP